MNKTIQVIMQDDKSIAIKLDNQLKHTINQDNRKISAKEIYNCLDYKKGDKYLLSPENPKNIDNDVLSFFSTLISEIVGSINNLGETAKEETIEP